MADTDTTRALDFEMVEQALRDAARREKLNGSGASRRRARQYLDALAAFGRIAALASAPDAARLLPAPGMTDLMVAPEDIDRFLAEHPPPAPDAAPDDTKIESSNHRPDAANSKRTPSDAKTWRSDAARLAEALVAMVYVHPCNCGDGIPQGMCARCRAVTILSFDPCLAAAAGDTPEEPA